MITVVGAPIAVGSIVHLYPDVFINVLVLIPALLWSMYLLYRGLPIVLHTTPERGMLMSSSLIGYLLVAFVSLLGITVFLWINGIGPLYGSLNMSDPAKKLSVEIYSDRIVTTLVMFSVIWAVIGMLAGVYVAAEIVWPALKFDQSWLSFGRLRTFHTNVVIFGFRCVCFDGYCILQRAAYLSCAAFCT